MKDTAITEKAPTFKSSTAITADAPAAKVALATAITSLEKPAPSAAWQVVEVLASLRVTVVLFILSFILVFYGTWAQVDDSIWTVVRRYFHGWMFVIPWKVLTLGLVKGNPESYFTGLPFPGGYTLGSLLLINLFSAHAVRFKFSWKRSGILITHSGLVVMMIGEWIYGSFGREARLTVHEGNQSNYIEQDLLPEIAIIDRSDPREDAVTIIPTAWLIQGTKVSLPELPFDLKIDQFMRNSEPQFVENLKGRNRATVGAGLEIVALPRKEGAGVSPDNKVDMPSAYVTLIERGTGKEMGTYLLSHFLNPLMFGQEMQEIDGLEHLYIGLRPKRTYLPFHVNLIDLEQEKHENSNMAKKYQSEVRVINPETGEDRNVIISMNNPLRYAGDTYYQANVHGEHITGLQVVRNPGWLMPYISCGMVTLGLLIHFGINLLSFLKRRASL